MASTNSDSEGLRPGRRPWRKSFQHLSCRLLCCSCLRGEKKDPLQTQEKKRDGGIQPPCLDRRGPGEKEVIQITVEDLGMVNPSFSLSEEDSPRNSVAHSACNREEKKTLKPLSSLPVRPCDERATNGEGDEEEEEDPLLFESGTDSTPASESLLTPPVINLIPPTPSDVIDDDQFFDINSEESVAHTSGSDGSFATGDQESYEEKMESVEPEESKECAPADHQVVDESKIEPDVGQNVELREEKENIPTKEEEKEKPKPRFLRSAYRVAPLPEYPRKRSFNIGINLLSFTEHNLDELSNKDASWPERLKAELCLLPHTAKMDTFTRLRKPATRSCSLGDTVTRSHTFHVVSQTTAQHQEEQGSTRQRRVTVASYMPQSKDQNGNFAEKEHTMVKCNRYVTSRSLQDMDRQMAKSLGELNTDEVCQWFGSIGLQKCLPLIREAELCGADIASVDVNTLDILHISTLEDREQLLSAIYKELHPPSTITQRLDSLLETFGPNNVERFTAALVSMSKSKSSPHVSCLNLNRSSLKLRSKSQNYMVQKNSQLIEITINASEQIVHLRTPKETTVGRIIDSCIKMLGMTEDKKLFTLKDKHGSSEELSSDQQIGSLLTLTSENRQLELQLCKKEKAKSVDSQDPPKDNCSYETGNVNQNVQVNQSAKEEKIRELNQQVDSLQNVILQVQELHHGLVAFCSELKSMDGEVDVEGLGSAELEQRLKLVQSQLKAKRQTLQTLRDNISNAAVHRKKCFEVRLVDKMKLNCQVFKEEISLVHLNRQVAHLQRALQDCCDKERAQKKGLAVGTLSQLVSPQCPAMLLVVQESLGPEGCYSFTCRCREGSGLVVVQVDNSLLCLDDRLVEVNGVPVVSSTEEELSALLLQGSSAQIVVLRRPPPTPTPVQHPLVLQHMVNPNPIHSISPERDAVTTETTSQREVMAI